MIDPKTFPHPLVPRDGAHHDYYLALDAKHFSAAAVGSRFLHVRRIEDLLVAATAERGNLDGDDRAQLIAAGSDPASFQDNCRYLMVHTSGTIGVVHSSTLPDSTPVHVISTKPGCPLSLVVDLPAEVSTDVATIIIGTNATGAELVWTAHPGVPIPAAGPGADPFAGHGGQTITLAWAKAVLASQTWLQIRSTSGRR